MKKILAVAMLAAFCWASGVRAQAGPRGATAGGAGRNARNDASSGASDDAAPEAGGNEFEIWSGGGPSVSGGVRHIGAWNAGARYGWVLTGPHGPSLLRGRFEYAVDAVPIFWVFEPGGTSIGAALDPFALKWDFVTREIAGKRVVPYAEIDGGALFSSRKTPPGISRVNFTPTAAFGVHALREKYNWSAEIRFLHISDAGLTNPNPGINTIEVRVGVGVFSHRK